MSVLAAVIAMADLCGAAPEPAAAPDPADAAAYTAVGDDARAAGDDRTAAIAYRKAIALDPANRRAAAGLAAICHGDQDEGDARTRLLDAIARYRAGDHAAAGAALSDIVRARTTASTGAGAHFFLGLIALERHDTGAAIRELELARSDPDYRALAVALLRLAHRDGAIAAALLIAPELDTNPQLVPDTPPSGAVTGAPAIDEDLLAVATVTARPAPWLAVRNALTWRDHRQLSALDFVSDDLELAAELAAGAHRLAIRYDLDNDVLAGANYLVANRATLAYRRDGAVAPVASYALRRRDFQRTTEQSFTGWVHAADAGAAVQLGAGIELDARATLRRELTADPSFANLAVGVRVALRTRSTARVRLIASAAGGYASYDAAQPDGLFRRDVPLEAAADLAAPPREQERFAEMLAEVDRLNRLTEEFLGLTRDVVLEPAEVELGALARAVADETRLVAPDAEITATGEATVHADPARLRQAILNLVLNATQIGGPGVRVAIEIGGDGDRARISIADDGPGVPAEIAARLFEPFVTARAGGTGLGLAAARRIAERHGGTLVLESRPGARGARFSIYLPTAARG